MWPESWQTVIWVLGPILVLVAAGFAWAEYQAHVLKTKITNLDSGLRFTAHGWSVEVQRSNQKVEVHTRHGLYTQEPLDGGGPQKTQHGSLTVSLQAPGLQIALKRGKDDGWRTVRFQSTGTERSVLLIEHVPLPVAEGFNLFAGQVRLWVEKLEQRIAQKAADEAAALAAADQQAADLRAKAEAEAAKAAALIPLSPDVQIAQWRKAAGFSGYASEVGLADNGSISWYIDLDPLGRITLHADKRTIHTTLVGARITALSGELEIGVRDDFWTEEETDLQYFRILKGLPPDERRAWKERLEALRDSLRKSDRV